MSVEAPRPEGLWPILRGLRRLFRHRNGVEQPKPKDLLDELQQQGFSLNGDEEFLSRVKVDFAISRIYYPGFGNDTQLNGPFNFGQTFYLDSEEDGHIFSRAPHTVIGNFSRAPFQDGVFDAVFIQDIHATDVDLRDILRTLRSNGIVIFSLDDCVDGDQDDLRRLQKHPELKELKLPYHNHIFRIFQKYDDQPQLTEPHPQKED